MAKTAQKAAEAVETFWKVKSGKDVFFHNNSSNEARMRGPNPEKLRPRGVGPRRVVEERGGEREERLPVEIRWDAGKFCLNWLR